MASSAWVALTAPLEAGRKDGETASTAAIYSYLDRLPASTLARLFASPSSALAIFRLLPMTARHLVTNLIWVDDVPAKDLEMWFSRRSEGKRQMEVALQALQRLHILEQEMEELSLNTNFRKSFKRALTGGGSHKSFGVPVDSSSMHFDEDQDTTETGVPIDIPFLDDYAKESWERILHYLVGPDLAVKPPPNILAMLQSSGLMVPYGTARTTGSAGPSLRITSRGFQFLLEDVNTQLWDILLRYLGDAEVKEMDTVEVLAFLFMLGSMELGKAYETSNLTRTQMRMAEDLKDYGLIYWKKNADYFYPTRLATTLTSNAPPLVSSDPAKANGIVSATGAAASGQTSEEQGYIVLETNYKVYAYTSNPLQIAVLNLFLSLRSRFPNLVIGMITRESIKSALSNGITAAQIITYLSTHAHPQMRKQTPLLPPTVVDQIRLWELEKNRIKDNEGYLYEDFRTAQDYELVLNYAKQLNVVIWEGPPTMRKFFVSSEGHITVRDFIKRRMAAAQGAQAGAPA
ncbi:transcription factor Tfb2 [Cystobasidium minutum MCA 4210]|uniref:transcription factor Tfb2 n=1 Tax=Cystobasidium minutum MCA 4210 TaxID=1397322 RepID=UPI0034CE51C1|eukprot:jgi/Rhomi1/166848/fgenesh1_kg.2_\